MVELKRFKQGYGSSHYWLRQFFVRLHCLGLWDKVFYNCKEWTWFSFLNMVACESWFYFLFQEANMVGAMWFNEFSDDSCYMHICSLKGYDYKLWDGQIGKILQNVLDTSDNPCYKIRARTLRKGLGRLYKNFGFSPGVKDANNAFIIERGK